MDFVRDVEIRIVLGRHDSDAGGDKEEVRLGVGGDEGVDVEGERVGKGGTGSGGRR